MSLLYRLIRPCLHRLEPEKAHKLAIYALAKHWLPRQEAVVNAALAQNLFGLRFENPVGLAAGFDKNAQAVSGLMRQGFGFAEVGTVTPKPQIGNPTPRLFRLSEDGAVINRLGFNNEGAEAAHARLVQRPSTPMVVGVNIGRNKDTINAAEDYEWLVRRMADTADYITINISSPNTQGLRDLQQKRQLTDLLTTIIEARNQSLSAQKARLPMLLKISPDIDEATKEDIAELALSFQLDGLIVSNTTIKRPNTLQNFRRSEVGGLSGKPLKHASTKVLFDMYKLTQGNIPLVGVGGISNAQDAYERVLAGASLLQIYTAFIYQGFGLVREINQGLVQFLSRDGFSHVSQAVGKAHSR